eukprot:gene4708-3372_t
MRDVAASSGSTCRTRSASKTLRPVVNGGLSISNPSHYSSQLVKASSIAKVW